MDNIKKDSFILQLTRYFPPLFILILAIIVTSYISYEHSLDLEEDKQNIKEQFINANKQTIQTNIEKTISRFVTEGLKKADEELEAKLKKQVYDVHKIMTSIYNEFKDTKSKEEIKQIIKSALRVIRFNENRGYFFIVNFEGENILQPPNPKIEGTSVINIKDSKGTYIVKEAINIAKSKTGEGFYTWFYHKPNEILSQKEKKGFIKKFEPYDWFLGTGEYVEDFKNKIKNEILDQLTEVRYKNDEYVFALDYEGNMLAIQNKKLKGANIFDFDKTAADKMGLRRFINSDKKSMFAKYKIVNNSNKNNYTKISYFKKIDQAKWIVGTGFSLDEVNILIKNRTKKLEKDHKEYMRNLYIFSILATIVLLIATHLISKYLKNRFISYQKNLEKQNAILLKAQDIAKLGEWELNLDTKEAYWSAKIIDIFGVKDCKEQFGPDFLKTIMYKEDWHCFEDSVNRCLNTKEEHFCRYRVKRPSDGKTVWIECRGELSQKNTILGTVQDITEVKENELEAEKKNKILYQQSKMAIMGEMIGNIAHQWKQPLSTISTAATGMEIQKELNSLSDEDFTAAIAGIKKSTNYLSHTIDDFKNFFKPRKERFSEFYISPIVKRTLSLVDAKFKTNEIEIIQNIEDIQIYSSQNELIQVLINILSNARDELIKHDFKRLIFITAYKKDDFLYLEIKDNAKGIPEGLEEKIFDSHFTTKENSGGTGIGLYMSKDIVTKLLQGDLSVENDTYTYENIEYIGAKFTIKLNL